MCFGLIVEKAAWKIPRRERWEEAAKVPRCSCKSTVNSSFRVSLIIFVHYLLPKLVFCF